MIKLIKFPAAFGLLDPSPFVVKTMMTLKIAGLALNTEAVTNPGRGPKGKLPAIADDGEVIGDSEMIRWYVERKYGVELDHGLNARERAVSHAFARMIEERLYWAMVYARWNEPAGWTRTNLTFFSAIPPGIRALAAAFIQRQVRRDLHGQGVGRHSQDEIYRLGVLDVQAMAAQLGDKPWFMGEAPSSVDCTAYLFVSGIVDPPFDNPVKDETLRHANLVAYAQRGKARFFS